jgi:hypothetical protein
MGERNSAYTVLVRQLEERDHLENLDVDNCKVDLPEVG